MSEWKVSAKTRRDAVATLLSDGHWHTTAEVCAADVGGSEGCRRLRELRANLREVGTWDIEKRSCDRGTQFEYRLIRRQPRVTARPGDEQGQLF